MQEEHLLSTINERTIKLVDASARKVVARMQRLKSDMAELEREFRELATSLEVMGLTNRQDGFFIGLEGKYRQGQPFYDASLNEACLKVLNDYRGGWLTKHQVEYLLVIGGYGSDAKDQTNSVDITLRRLADEGKCEVERVRGGPHGNRYRSNVSKSEGKHDVKDSRATK